MIWKWVNMSSKVVPGRNIKWEFRIPYVFSVGGSLFNGFSLNIWLLFFHIYFITDVSCGRFVRFQKDKWYIGIMIHNGWAFYLNIGVFYNKYLDWKTKRAIKRMSPLQVFNWLENFKSRDE